MNPILPVIMIVVSVTFYNISQKSTPALANPYSSLIVAYLVALLITILLFFVNGADKGMLQAFKSLNWTSLVLGVTIVGIELGYLYLYRTGWNIAVGSLVVSIIIAIVLIFVGVLLYKESLYFNQIFGIVLCVVGLIFINR